LKRYIYNCYGGSHSSVTAAAIHLGILPDRRVAGSEELLNTPYFDAQIARDHGRIRFFGFDENGDEVYVVGRINLGSSYEKIMRAFLALAGGRQGETVFIDTMPYVNIFMMAGGCLSRRFGSMRWGRALVVFGTRLAYPSFVRLVQKVKAGLVCKGEE